MTTATEEWKEFAEQIGLNEPGVPEIQRREMRRAFFAGQIAMFHFQTKHLAALPDDEAVKGLDVRVQELMEFGRNFRQRN